MSAIAIAATAIGGAVAVTRIVHERDRAVHESEARDHSSGRGQRLIDYIFSHVRTPQSEIGSLDLRAGLGREIEQYYERLAEIPGGIPVEDARLAKAVEVVGEAEDRSGRPELAELTFSEERDQLVTLVAMEPMGRTEHVRQMIAVLDYQVAAVEDERGQLDAAIASLDVAARVGRTVGGRPGARDPARRSTDRPVSRRAAREALGYASDAITQAANSRYAGG